jgi:peptidoglycan/LPS O-acetylase OafA/YrhL
VLVLLGHLAGTRGFPTAFGFFIHFADFGVRVFFVISGFLITTLLLKEQARTGSIKLRDFYLRRAYRILPAAYAYMGVVTVVYWSRLHFGAVAAAFLYVTNYADHTWVFGHLWSLSIEEQFYLLWPLTLAFAFTKRRGIAIGVILAGPAMRILFYFTPFRATAGTYFPTVADALATGCLLAISRPNLNRYAHILKSRWMLAAGVLALVIQYSKSSYGPAYYVLGLTIIHVCIALTINHVITRPYAILNASPIVYIGVLSYSLYLCQQPFLNRASATPITAFPLNIVLAVSAALLCHYFVERPFLNARRRHMGAECDLARNAKSLAPSETYGPVDLKQAGQNHQERAGYPSGSTASLSPMLITVTAHTSHSNRNDFSQAGLTPADPLTATKEQL